MWAGTTAGPCFTPAAGSLDHRVHGATARPRAVEPGCSPGRRARRRHPRRHRRRRIGRQDGSKEATKRMTSTASGRGSRSRCGARGGATGPHHGGRHGQHDGEDEGARQRVRELPPPMPRHAGRPSSARNRAASSTIMVRVRRASSSSPQAQTRGCTRILTAPRSNEGLRRADRPKSSASAAPPGSSTEMDAANRDLTFAGAIVVAPAVSGAPTITRRRRRSLTCRRPRWPPSTCARSTWPPGAGRQPGRVRRRVHEQGDRLRPATASRSRSLIRSERWVPGLEPDGSEVALVNDHYRSAPAREQCAATATAPSSARPATT